MTGADGCSLPQGHKCLDDIEYCELCGEPVDHGCECTRCRTCEELVQDCECHGGPDVEE